MQNIFTVKEFQFPYKYKFPGQASDEQILFVVRENKMMLLLRQVIFVFTAILVLMLGMFLLNMISNIIGVSAALPLLPIILISLLVFVLGFWWVSTLWKKSICIVTTKRLTKFVYTTPFNRHSLSLPLDQIVDTGSYTKGLIQALFRLGTFTARSAAASSGLATDEESSGSNKRINKKYFYIENVSVVEDLQHYVAKLLDAFKHNRESLSTFRPFIPELKGERRKEFMKKWPEYWS
ncbi:MAG: hypothetical protein ABFQ62_02435 [Patescibacteria group bacterium]